MPIKVKKIYKINHNSLKLMDDGNSDNGPNTVGSSSDLMYTTMVQTTSQGVPLPIYLINWWCPDLPSTKGYNKREINGLVPTWVSQTDPNTGDPTLVPVWPPIAYQDEAHLLPPAFSYICWTGQNSSDGTPIVSTTNSPANCTCVNKAATDDYGNCPKSEHNPSYDNNGGAPATPFYPTGWLLINKSGSYDIELILDGYMPACVAGDLPKLQVGYFESMNAMLTNVSGPGSPPGTPPQALPLFHNCKWSVNTVSVTVPYNGKTYATWYPSYDCSTVAPPPSRNSDKNPTEMSSNGKYLLQEGWVLQFAIENTCSNPGGAFTGTIQITPQFTTYPSYD
jgi:hypothetical protein